MLWRAVLCCDVLQVGIIRGAPLLEKGVGTANTSLFFHAGRLLALHEGDLPYQVSGKAFGTPQYV
jgi:carotenoid cleavage dioxygenase